jgi:hypothetical protein
MAAAGTLPGIPLDIPDFTISGVLPPYLGATAANVAAMSPYQTTLTRIANKLCASDERKLIFRGLLQYRGALNAIGFTSGFQWLSGSFMENIEAIESRAPRDVDIVTFVHRPSGLDQVALQALLAANPNIFIPSRAKATYYCDAYFVDLDMLPEGIVDQSRYWFGLFAHRRTGIWKGLLQLPLAVTQDDTDASVVVGP